MKALPALMSILNGVEYVFHEAGLVSVPASISQPLDNHEINITGTLNVLEAAAKCGVKRVVMASSAAIYGNSPELPKTEKMLPVPDSPYGLASVAKEHYASIYSKLYDLSVVSLRYFSVYGPRQAPSSPYSGVISRFVETLAAGEVPTIFGDGEQTRDFVFVKDVVKANLLAMEHPDITGGEVYNIATGHAVSLLELLQTVNPLNSADTKPIFDQARPGDIRHSRACISKAKCYLGYEPSFTLEEGLSDLLAWSQGRPEWREGEVTPSDPKDPNP